MGWNWNRQVWNHDWLHMRPTLHTCGTWHIWVGDSRYLCSDLKFNSYSLAGGEGKGQLPRDMVQPSLVEWFRASVMTPSNETVNCDVTASEEVTRLKFDASRCLHVASASFPLVLSLLYILTKIYISVKNYLINPNRAGVTTIAAISAYKKRLQRLRS